MRVGIYFNKNYIADNLPYVEKIERAFGGKGECRVVRDCHELDGIDVLFVLGGDGTILTVASACALRGVKIIGINYGHLGFLAEFEREKLDEAVALVAGGAFSTHKRTMLSVEYGGEEYLALNDLVIQRNTGGAHFCNTVSLHAEIDGATVDNFSSDGIIVSTPTGSTAYSLSAGGSILTPDIGAFILTPICAHSLHSRPVVFSDGSTLTIRALKGGERPLLIVDGRAEREISANQTVTVKKSAHTVEFITNSQKNFFDKLLIKLNIWSK